MLCFAGALQEKQRQVIAKKNVAGGGTCTKISGAPTQELTGDSISKTILYYSGTLYTPGSNIEVCKLEFNQANAFTTTNCIAKIFTLSGDNLNTEVATSSAISTGTGWLEFALTSNASLTASTTYALVYNCYGGGEYYKPSINSSSGNTSFRYWEVEGKDYIATQTDYAIAIRVHSIQ